MTITFGDPNPMVTGDDGPSAAGYILGVVLIIVGIAGGIFWGVTKFIDFDDAIDDFERVPVGEIGRIELEEGDFVVYAERGGGEAATAHLQNVRMRPAGEEGADEIEFEPYDSEFTYDLSNRVGRAQLTFEIEEAGEYQVRVDEVGSTATTAAFGPSVASKLVTAILGGFIIAGAGIILGTIVLIVTGVRRRKHRQRSWLDAYGGAPGGPGGPATWNPTATPGYGTPPPGTGTWNPAPPPPGGGFPPPSPPS